MMGLLVTAADLKVQRALNWFPRLSPLFHDVDLGLTLNAKDSQNSSNPL